MRENEDDYQGSDEDSKDEEISESGLSETILSVVWAAGKLGAAYYSLQTSELFMLPDTAEAAPDFETLRAFFKQVSPKIILACVRQDARFLTILKQLSGDLYTETGEGNESVSLSGHSLVSNETPKPNLFIEPGREFGPDPCKRRLQEIRLPAEPKSNNDVEHLYYITSLIPFSNIAMVRAAGALMKFLDKRGTELLQVDLVNGRAPVLNLKICTLTDLVMVDYTAWDSLQIFNQDVHPSAAKQGASGSKEGLSVFGLFNKCLTSQGSNYLRLQLLRPTRNLDVLKRRLDVIEHCKFLLKLSLLHTSYKEWKQLYLTLHNCILLGEICSKQPSSIELFKDITNQCKTNAVVRAVTSEIARVIDFDQSSIHQRFYPQAGLNEELDRKRQQYNTLPEVMSMIAAEEMQTLPSFVEQCCIVYIPEVGYLLAIKLWAEGLTPEQMVLEGLEYKFTSIDLAYYKSKRTRELDTVLGDSQVTILELETYIMISLTENILRNVSSLVKVNSLISELDSLMTMANLARDKKYVRPTIIDGCGKLEIIEGRHPLIELKSDFVPNSTTFGDGERIVILTGPNASGKSIYLKQIGVIAIMALSGSFVPANSAVIPAFDRICTRIYAQESIAVGLSTFMIDINQMSLARRNATKYSLVIVDEFGKGTSEADGLGLLQATLESFGEEGLDSPTIFVSTHYYSLLKRLPQEIVFKPQTMDFITEGDKLIYLFRLKSGSCQNSYARVVANDTGTLEEVITRSAEIDKVLRSEASESSITLRRFQEDKEAFLIKIGTEFLTLNLTEVDPFEYLQGVVEGLEPFKAVEEPEALFTSTPNAREPGTRDAPFSDFNDSNASSYATATDENFVETLFNTPLLPPGLRALAAMMVPGTGAGSFSASLSPSTPDN